jgi:hypothetical protein
MLRTMLHGQLEPMIDAIARWLPPQGGQPSVYASETSVTALVKHAIECAEASAVQLMVLADHMGPHEESPATTTQRM